MQTARDPSVYSGVVRGARCYNVGGGRWYLRGILLQVDDVKTIAFPLAPRTGGICKVVYHLTRGNLSRCTCINAGLAQSNNELY